MKQKEYTKEIKESLKERYGEIKPEWNLLLGILEDSMKRLYQVKKEIDTNGLFMGNNRNPLLTTEKELVAQILKISQKIGVMSPYEKASLTKMEKCVGEDDDTDDFVENLTNNG